MAILLRPFSILTSQAISLFTLIRHPYLCRWRLYALISKLRHHNPFIEHHERHTHTIPASELIYSDSPVSMAVGIAKRLPLRPSDLIVDCGSGFGGVCFDLHLLTGAKTLGIDCMPSLINFSSRLSVQLGLNNSCRFVLGNFLDQDLSNARVVLVTATCLSDRTTQALWRKCEDLRVGSYLIIITQEIESEHFELCESFNTTFEWGHDMIRIYRKS